MKHLLSFIILTIILHIDGKSFAKNDSRLTEKLRFNSLTQKTEQNLRPKTNIIQEAENFKLQGDSSIEKEQITNVSLKFEPHISFNDFKVALIDNRKYAKLDIKSNKGANYFRTILREGYNADTANFAGHYTLVFWGCGSPCQSSMLIDRKTGNIYNAPDASLGYGFRVNSSMLIVNPPDSNNFYEDCIYCKPMIYVFDERTKTFNEIKTE